MRPAPDPSGRHGCRRDGADLLVAVRVVPRASRDAIEPEAECLKIRITAPPVDGKANAHLMRMLAKLFGVPVSRVRLEQGAGSRHKRFRILEPARLPDFLTD